MPHTIVHSADVGDAVACLDVCCLIKSEENRNGRVDLGRTHKHA